MYDAAINEGEWKTVTSMQAKAMNEKLIDGELQ